MERLCADSWKLSLQLSRRWRCIGTETATVCATESSSSIDFNNEVMCLVHIVALFVGKTAEKDTGLIFISFLK